MQKKLIALAIAAAFSAPALADNANINIYGKAILTLDSFSSNQTGSVSNMRVKSNASRFGVKGSEDVGDGLKAIYQYEVQVDADGTGAAGAKGFGNGTRNSEVGLAGGFGEISLGIWDTPYKVTHNKIELFDNTTAYTATNLIGVAANGKSYVTRQAGEVQYISPSLGGVKIAAMYSPDTTKTTAKNATVLSMSATYDQDGIYAAFGYDRRPDQTTNSTTDSATRLVGRYDFASAWIGAAVERIKVNTSTTVSYTQSNAELVGGVKMDASTLALSYAKNGTTNVANTGASQVSLRYGYNFSKRTEAFAAYTSLKNDAAATYGSAIYTGVAAGATVKALGVGIVHSF